RLEEETVAWAREILEKSPTAIRFLKAAFNADTDGLAGIQQLAGDATLLFYLTDEAKEGRNAFLEKRKPDFSKFPRFPRGGRARARRAPRTSGGGPAPGLVDLVDGGPAHDLAGRHLPRRGGQRRGRGRGPL